MSVASRIPETAARVRLRVEIDDQYTLADLSETRSDVDGRRCLAYAALLVRHREDPAGHGHESTKHARSSGPVTQAPIAGRSGRLRAMPVRRGNRVGVSRCTFLDNAERAIGVWLDVVHLHESHPPTSWRNAGDQARWSRFDVVKSKKRPP